MKRTFRVFVWLLAILAGLLAATATTLYFLLRASLPQLDGNIPLDGISMHVTISRDAQGTAVIRADDRIDAMRALGYVHAQERFFEMDLTRRSAAGELSALFGAATVAIDKEKRMHRLRQRMAAHWLLLPDAQRNLISVYTQGVNAGVAALPVRPWQYLLLRAAPQPWQEIDSMLVICEMYYMLQARDFDQRFSESLLREQVGDTLFDWLKPLGGDWDAPLDTSRIRAAALPASNLLNTRLKTPAESDNVAINANAEFSGENIIGSNNWAVGGALSAHGGAVLANDMHLNHGVPNIWFRTQFAIGSSGSARRIAGVTLPGLPAMVIASNGDIAWGFTNATGKWFDWVPLENDEPIKVVNETIDVKFGDAVVLEVRETRWGPVRSLSDAQGKRDYSLRWSLYQPGAVNADLGEMMFAHSVDEGVAIAQRSGIPQQNILIADKSGNIAWTIAGRIPRYRDWAYQAARGRFTPAAALPLDWLTGSDYPLIKNPADARLSSANNRLLGGADGAKIGDGGFDLGARGGQIRDRLRERTQFDESALYAIQRDDEARFFKRWAELARGVAAKSKQPGMDEVVKQLDDWNGRADVSQTGHRIARAFRLQVSDSLWKAWIRAAAPALARPQVAGTPSNYPGWDGRGEYAVWQALTARAEHLLPMPYAGWDEFLEAQLASVRDDLIKQNGTLAGATWGKRNTANIRHPIARAVPQLSRWLNMPGDQLPGDNNMPLVAAPAFGASERMVVAPGREAQGIFAMPGGQSGHPLSPFFGAGHADWVRGGAQPLLAGETRHTLRFAPALKAAL